MVSANRKLIADRIRRYFPSVTLPSPMLDGLAPGGDADADDVREYFSGKAWTEVLPIGLSNCAQDSGGFSDEMLAFFLPAFLVCLLERGYPTAENLGLYVPSWIERLHPLRRFGYSRDQVQLVRDAWACEIEGTEREAGYPEPHDALLILDIELEPGAPTKGQTA